MAKPNIDWQPTGTTAGDFGLSIALGQIGGYSGGAINGLDTSVGTTEKAIGCGAGRYAFQTSAVALEILSSDANDTSAGTGARTVTVTGLDASYIEQSEVVILNGITQVALSKTYLRVNRVIVTTAGSGGVNAGNITIQVSGGGDEQSLIQVGANVSEVSVHTVPAGKIDAVMSVVFAVQKGQDAIIRAYITPLGRLPVRATAIPLYESPFIREFVVPVTLNEKTDIEVTAQSSQVGTNVFTSLQMISKDNQP